MSCESHRSAIRALALGEPVVPNLERHLAVCPPCSALLESDRRVLGRIANGIEELLSVQASPGFVARVRTRLGESGPGAFPWVHRWWLPVALSVAGLLVAVSLVGRSPRVSPSVAPSADPMAVGDQLAEAIAAPLTNPGEAPLATLPETGLGPSRASSPAPQEPAAPRARSDSPALVGARPDVARRVVPEVLIPARDPEAARRFVANRRPWIVEIEPLEPVAVGTSSAVDWEMPPPESPPAFGWELDGWPLTPGD